MHFEYLVDINAIVGYLFMEKNWFHLKNCWCCLNFNIYKRLHQPPTFGNVSMLWINRGKDLRGKVFSTDGKSKKIAENIRLCVEYTVMGGSVLAWNVLYSSPSYFSLTHTHIHLSGFLVSCFAVKWRYRI